MLCVPTHAPDACDMLLLSVPPPKGWGGNSKLTLRRGEGSWARESRGRPRTRAGRQSATQETRRRISKCLGLRYGCTTCPSISILCPTVISVECLFFFVRPLSLACGGPLASTRRTRRGTRPPATSLPDKPAPLVRMLSFVNSVWEFGRLQTSQNFLCPSGHTRHCPFFSACLSGGSFVREFSRCDPVGGIQRMCPTRHRLAPFVV